MDNELIAKLKIKQIHYISLNPESTPYVKKLFTYLADSLKNISLENDNIINLLDLLKTKNSDDSIFFNNDTVYDLVKLSEDQINILIKNLKYIKNNLAEAELDLCLNEINEGLHNLTCVKEEKDIYKELFRLFNNHLRLKKDEIINEELKGTNPYQEQYFITLFSNTTWTEIDSVSILGFLEGLDFEYLNDQAYFFALPACIKYALESFENSKTPLIFDWLAIFLSNQNRIKHASQPIRQFIVRYLKFVLKFESNNLYDPIDQDISQCLQLWEK